MTDSNKKVLVTGGAGFIGSHLVDSLLRDDWSVTVIDNFDPFYDQAVKRKNIADHEKHQNYRLVEVDIRDDEALFSLCIGEYSAIVHLAAKAGVRPSIEDPVSYQMVNVTGTQNMLELARRCNVPQFVFASSSSVYGINKNVPWSEEDQVLLPISPYASTKVSGELLGHVYSHLYGIRFVALRFFTVYGPRQRPDLAIHKFSRLILEGKKLPVFGDGQSRRDYTHIDDIVRGIRAAIEYKGTPYDIFNLGNCATISLSEMITILEQKLGVSADIDRLDVQPGDVPQTWADLTRSKKNLGYEPTIEFRDGVSDFVRWIKE